MVHIAKVIRLLLVGAVFGFLAAANVKADPLTFSNVVILQNNNTTHVDLFTHQNTTFYGPELNFLIDISGTLPAGTTNTVLVTYSEFGSLPITQSVQIPFLGSLQPPFSLLFSFTSPGANFQGVGATLTVDILGSSPDFIVPGGQPVDSYTYSFTVAQPVPEPATIFLLATGLGGVIAARRRKRK